LYCPDAVTESSNALIATPANFIGFGTCIIVSPYWSDIQTTSVRDKESGR
jgi:hypothetical protein